MNRPQIPTVVLTADGADRSTKASSTIWPLTQCRLKSRGVRLNALSAIYIPYLRKTAGILGVSPTSLSLLLNGKRLWRGHLKERYLELVNTFVNIPETSRVIINGHNGYSYLKSGGFEKVLTPDPLLAKHLQLLLSRAEPIISSSNMLLSPFLRQQYLLLPFPRPHKSIFRNIIMA